MSTVTVYTCNVNNYDFVLPPLTDDPNLIFVCFTDRPQKRIKGWDVRSLQSPSDITNPTLINRYHKFFPHKLGFETDWSIYVDGNMRVLRPISDLVRVLQSAGAVMACLKHPWRATVEEEIAACERDGKLTSDQTADAFKRYREYLQDGMPSSTPLYANKVVIRDHTKNTVIAAMGLWWQELLLTPRDQISLPYIVWKTGITMKMLPLEKYNDFHWYSHRKTGLLGMRQLILIRKDEPGFRSVYRLLRKLRQMTKIQIS